MTDFEHSEKKQELITSMKHIANNMTEEEFEAHGVHITFDGLRLLTDRITQLETEIELHLLFETADKEAL